MYNKKTIVVKLINLIFLGIFYLSFVSSAQAATDAVLSFDQATVSVDVGDTVTLVARVNPGTNEVGAVELDVTFNPSILHLDSITRSSAFNVTLGGPTIDNVGTGNADGTGSIDVGLLTNPATYVTTTSDVATFVFTAEVAATDSPVAFAVTSDASAHGSYVVLTRTPSAVTVVGEEEEDSTPPVLSAGSPSGALTAGTTSTTMSVTTDENATCRYATSSGTAFSSMTNDFSGATTSHTVTVSGLTNGSSYGYFVRCQDGDENVNTTDYLISFSVASPANTSDNDDDDDDNKKKKKKKKSVSARTISVSKKSLKRGQTIIERGKKFSKSSNVALYFEKSKGVFYPPIIMKTTSTGAFSLSYRIPLNKPAGLYKWYAVDLKTGRKSKLIRYKVR